MIRRLALLAWLLLPGAAPAAEAPAWREMGRLFTTPETRETLDRMRLQARQPPPPPPEESPAEQKAEEATPNPPQVTVKGMVQSNRGKKVVWLDGFNTMTGTLTDDQVRIRLEESRRQGVVFTLPADPDARHTLKPGQILDTRTNRVHEGYNPPHAPSLAIGQELPSEPETKTAEKPAAPPPPTPPQVQIQVPVQGASSLSTILNALKLVSPDAATALDKVQAEQGKSNK